MTLVRYKILNKTLWNLTIRHFEETDWLRLKIGTQLLSTEQRLELSVTDFFDFYTQILSNFMAPYPKKKRLTYAVSCFHNV